MEGQDTTATWAPQSPDLSNYHSQDLDEPEHPQHRGYRGSISHHLPESPPNLKSPILQTKYTTTPPSSMPRVLRTSTTDESMQDAEYLPDASEKSRGKRKEGNGTGNGAAQVDAILPPTVENVNITVHFPVARIKRIMQADDDVGKVAQVTPVVVSKALELFMIALVTKAAAEAKARNSKRVGALHLKQAVISDEKFDFLSDIVSKVADAPPPADKNDGDAMDVDTKKKKPAGRRKKKAESNSP